MEYSMKYDVYNSHGVFIASLHDENEASDLALEIGGYVDGNEVGYDENDNGEDKIVYSTKEDNDDYLDYMDCECDNEE